MSRSYYALAYLASFTHIGPESADTGAVRTKPSLEPIRSLRAHLAVLIEGLPGQALKLGQLDVGLGKARRVELGIASAILAALANLALEGLEEALACNKQAALLANGTGTRTGIGLNGTARVAEHSNNRWILRAFRLRSDSRSPAVEILVEGSCKAEHVRKDTASLNIP